MLVLHPVIAGPEVLPLRQLFAEYAASLPIDLSFQGFSEELTSLPGAYAPPLGLLHLARVDGIPAGCIGLRPFNETTGEVKRLYVRPAFRGQGVARALVGAALAAGRAAGYQRLVLDTLASMHEAIRLYTSFGFAPIDAYYANPHPDARYFGLTLSTGPILARN